MFAVIASSLDLARNDLTRNMVLDNADASGDWKVWSVFSGPNQAKTEAEYLRTGLGVPCRVMVKK